jgi:hypothetical protein
VTFFSTTDVDARFVESTTDGGKFYRLSGFSGDTIRCSCPGYTYHRHCKHADIARAEFRPARQAPATSPAGLFGPRLNPACAPATNGKRAS